MRSARPAVAAVFLVALVMVAVRQRADPPAPPEQELSHFAGVLDHRQQTLDPVLADLYGRAARALEAGDAAAAETLYREAIAKYPSDPDGYNALGTCLSFQRRYDEARGEYNRALQLDPGSRDALYGLGCVAYDQRQYDEAVGHLEAVLAKHPSDADAHRVLGLTYDALDNRPKAREHYQRATELNPTFAQEKHIRERLEALKP